jgi:hypothetical protein
VQSARQRRSRKAGSGAGDSVLIQLHPFLIASSMKAWVRPRNSTSRNRRLSLMMKTRQPSPRSTKAYAMRKPAEPFQWKKFANCCPSGLPPPLHPKSAKRPRRDHRPYRRGGRRCGFAFWQCFARPCGLADSFSPHGKYRSKTIARSQVAP